MMAVRPGGRVVLMGGVSMDGGKDLLVPYRWLMRNCVTLHGSWMYPREAITHLVQMMRADALSLDLFACTEFGLKQANEAVEHAAKHAVPFAMNVLRPAPQ